MPDSIARTSGALSAANRNPSLIDVDQVAGALTIGLAGLMAEVEEVPSQSAGASGIGVTSA